MDRSLVSLTINLLQEKNLLGPNRGATGANVTFDCPFVVNHGGRKQQNTPSFHIHMEQGLWHCFGCKQGGSSIYGLYSTLMGVSDDDAKRHIGTPTNVLASLEQTLASLKGGLEERPFCKTAYPATIPLVDAPLAQAYIDGRGVPRAIQDKMLLSYYPDQFMPRAVDESGKENKGRVPGRRIIFPIFWGGQPKPIGYSGRSVFPEAEWVPKYYRPVENMSLAVYNPMDHTPHDTQEIYVVEGEISLAVAEREGFPTVGTFGSFLSPAQATFLSQFKKVRLMYDPDNAGQAGMARAVADYGAWMNLLPVHLPPKMDPGDMPVGFGRVVRESVEKADKEREEFPFEAMQRYLLDSVRV